MCGRYAITMPPDAMRRLFGYEEHPNFPPRWNIAPTQPVPVIRAGAGGTRHFVLVRWGLVPEWATKVGTHPLFNARGETVAEKPAFRSAFRRRRCLVPADGFYEWKATASASGAKGGEGGKQPYLIRRRDRAPMAFAGIWEHWQSPEGSELESCAIITTAANATLAPLHHRMPVILSQNTWDMWLDTSEKHSAEARALIAPAPDDLLIAQPVSRRVNAVANDDAGVQAPPEDGVPDDTTKANAAPEKSDPQMSLF